MGDVDSPERYGSAIAELASKGGRDYRDPALPGFIGVDLAASAEQHYAAARGALADCPRREMPAAA